MTRSCQVLAFLFLALGATSAEASPQSRLMVVETRAVTLPEPFERVSLGNEVTTALETSGCQVAATCRAGDCSSMPRPVSVTAILSVDAEYIRERYSCSVRMQVRNLTGEMKFGASQGSDACPATDLVDYARKLATQLCHQVQAEAPQPADAGVRTPLPDTASNRHLLAPGVALVTGGAVLAGLGAYLWYLDGRCAHSGVVAGETRCGDLYNTEAIGIPVTLGGAAAVGLGIWALWPRAAANVAIAPGRVLLRGRF
jgi:hypothetical protein